MIRTMTDLWQDQRGATAIEYGLIASLVVIACITALNGVANANTDMWNDVKSQMVESSAKARG